MMLVGQPISHPRQTMPLNLWVLLVLSAFPDTVSRFPGNDYQVTQGSLFFAILLQFVQVVPTKDANGVYGGGEHVSKILTEQRHSGTSQIRGPDSFLSG